MAREVKHFSLDRINGTELRVIADTERGVLPVLGIEEDVIRQYMAHKAWLHEWVTLFILHDFSALVRQLASVAEPPPGGQDALRQRPVVNVYDLADAAGCHVFVNWQAMARQGYWEEPTIIRALLAHEHAHPPAECSTTRASRAVVLELADNLDAVLDGHPGRVEELRRVLNSIARRLCVEAPREVLTNDLAIRCGFADSIAYLDRTNAGNARASLLGRQQVASGIDSEVAQGSLSPAAARALLLVGDLQGYTDMAIETASFYREQHRTEAQEIESVLVDHVFPSLLPGVDKTYLALREHYEGLRDDLSAQSLADWCEGAGAVLSRRLAQDGLSVRYRARAG